MRRRQDGGDHVHADCASQLTDVALVLSPVQTITVQVLGGDRNLHRLAGCDGAHAVIVAALPARVYGLRRGRHDTLCLGAAT